MMFILRSQGSQAALTRVNSTGEEGRVDNYPDELAPYSDGGGWPEPFSRWWERVHGHYPSVPKNLARQWLWRHWGNSSWRWLPSEGARFSLVLWGPRDVRAVQMWREPEDQAVSYGRDLLTRTRNLPRGQRYAPTAIMDRTGKWPAPPLVIDHQGTLPCNPWDDLPRGLVVVEGHRRFEVAKALAKEGRLKDELPVWVLSY